MEEIVRRLDSIDHALHVTARLFAEQMKEISEAVGRAEFALIKLASSEAGDHLHIPSKSNGDDRGSERDQ